MPMEDINIGCPVCGRPLTDVDGLIECQNTKEGHFSWGYGKPYFNFTAWSKRQHKVTRKTRNPFKGEKLDIDAILSN
jgi:hypothetical protein